MTSKRNSRTTFTTGMTAPSPRVQNKQARLVLAGGHVSTAKTVQQADIFGRPIRPYVDVMESIRMAKDLMIGTRRWPTLC